MLIKRKNIAIIAGIITLIIIKGIGFDNISAPIKITLLLLATIFIFWAIKSVKRPDNEKKSVLVVGGMLIFVALLIAFATFIETIMPNYYYRIKNVIGVIVAVIFVLIIVLPTIILMKRRRG
jgi:Na+/proline symporter